MTHLPALAMMAVLLSLSLPLAAQPQQNPAPAQQNQRRQPQQNCLNEKEAEAEAEVRTGIQLRETLRRCAMLFPEGQTALDDWYAFDNENGDRIRAAVDTRQQALERIQRKGPYTNQNTIDAVVATRKPLQVNEGVCQSAYEVIERIRTEGWPGFKYYAKLQQNLLAKELPFCRP